MRSRNLLATAAAGVFALTLPIVAALAAGSSTPVTTGTPSVDDEYKAAQDAGGATVRFTPDRRNSGASWRWSWRHASAVPVLTIGKRHGLRKHLSRRRDPPRGSGKG